MIWVFFFHLLLLLKSFASPRPFQVVRNDKPSDMTGFVYWILIKEVPAGWRQTRSMTVLGFSQLGSTIGYSVRHLGNGVYLTRQTKKQKTREGSKGTAGKGES